MGLLVLGGFACLFVSLFVVDGCSRCCGGFTWLMVVHGGFFWYPGWVFLIGVVVVDGLMGLGSVMG